MRRQARAAAAASLIPIVMSARASLGRIVALAAAIAFSSARGADAPPICKALPGIEKLGQPKFPDDVEVRGLPNPVMVLVEFTVRRDGSVVDPLAIESDAGSYAKLFEVRALQAIQETRFKPPAGDCRGRMRVRFSIVSGLRSETMQPDK